MSALAFDIATPSVFPISVETYHFLYENGHISNKVELVEGVIFTKMPKNPIHSDIVRKLFEYLKKTVHFSVFKEDPITLQNSEPEPDIAILPSGDYSQEHPKQVFLIIEVADSSLQFDRQKANMYAKGNVPEYLIFNLKDEKIEYYKNPKEGIYTEIKILSNDEQFVSAIIPELHFQLKDFLPVTSK